MASIRKLQCFMSLICRGSRLCSTLHKSSTAASEKLIDMEKVHSAHNANPIPVVFSAAKGSSIWDPEGKRYLDFYQPFLLSTRYMSVIDLQVLHECYLNGVRAVRIHIKKSGNLIAIYKGHCHPKIVKAFQEQAEKLTLCSRGFYNDKYPLFAKYLTQSFGYDMVLPMNTGAEGVETALKLARKWGYKKKKIPNDEAIIVSCCGCFHGRTLAVISMSCDNEATREFGPLLPGHLKVDFGDAVALEKIFKEHGDRIAGFLFEPIQGERGIIIPPDGYLKAVRELCTKYNILMMADEVQSGFGRSGKLLACDWENVRPDLVIVGKSLGGGVIPVSAVLADKDVMLGIQPGQHGSTFGGNPLASAVAIASLEVIKDERLAERSAKLGEELRNQLVKVQERFPQYIKSVRGRGLFNAVELKRKALSPVSVYDICLKLKERGVLTRPAHGSIIRLTPPFSISSDEVKEGSKALHDVLEIDVPQLMKESPQSASPTDSSNICNRCGRNFYASKD